MGMTSEGLGDMFEYDFSDICCKKMSTHVDTVTNDTTAGVETTVDRSSKNNRIRNWINQVRQNQRICNQE